MNRLKERAVCNNSLVFKICIIYAAKSLDIFCFWFIGGDEHKEGDASYRLGLAYEHSGDCETALMVCIE